MISPEEIKKKAERCYEDFLRGAIAHESIFPIDLPIGRVPKDYLELLEAVTELINASKAIAISFSLKIRLIVISAHQQTIRNCAACFNARAYGQATD